MRTLLIATAAALGLLALASPASAQFLTFVSAAGNDANTCFVQAAPCKTLQRGINQTSAGGELRLLTSLVSNGFINKSMTVEGGKNTVVGTIAVNSATAIVRFRRLNLNGRHAFPIGFNLINAATVHIEESSVERYTGDGISLAANVSTELFISDTVSRDNGDEGLAAEGPTTAKVTVEDSRFENNAGVGLFLTGGAQGSASHSIAFGNSAGIFARDSAGLNVVDTVAAANSDFGIGATFIVTAPDLTLTSCDAHQNNNVGLLVGLGGTTARISDCVVTANGDGVNIFVATALTLGNNLIAGNTDDVDGTLTPLPGE